MFDNEMFYEIVEKAKKYDQLVKLIDRRELHCSFCNKGQVHSRKLIAGPGIYICNECVELCNEILNEDNESKKEEDK